MARLINGKTQQEHYGLNFKPKKRQPCQGSQYNSANGYYGRRQSQNGRTESIWYASAKVKPRIPYGQNLNVSNQSISRSGRPLLIGVNYKE